MSSEFVIGAYLAMAFLVFVVLADVERDLEDTNYRYPVVLGIIWPCALGWAITQRCLRIMGV